MSAIFDPELRNRQPIACPLFEAAVDRGRLAHAYLLSGRALADKWLIANSLARHLNCERADKLSTGPCRGNGQSCQNCRWIGSREHPQAWITLSGDDTKTGKISVEKARALADELSKTTSYHRVVVIPDAQEEAFHRPSANALLKTIEEPAPNAFFMLFAAHEDDVLATVVSRCQVVPILKPCEGGLWLSARTPSSEPASGELASLQHSVNDLTVGRFGVARTTRFGKGTAGALEWAAEMAALISDSTPAHLVVDLAVSAQVETLRQAAAFDPEVSGYLCRVLELADAAKAQLDHYVKPQTAIESFALELYRLDSAHDAVH